MHIEATTRCNAWCPGCSRSNNGYGIKKNLEIQDLSLNKLKDILSKFPNCNTVQLCGNDGDPCAAKNILDQIKIIKNTESVKFLQIHTNGSLRSKQWWENLASQNQDINLEVWFGIDGLEDTHAIYRQGTDFKKILSNASSFISKGGKAVWQFLVFAHNEHQLLDAYKLSKTMKFSKFLPVKHTAVSGQERHYKTGELLGLKKSNLKQVENLINDANNTIFKKNCMHLNLPSVYLSASGSLFPCCYLARTYENEEFPEESKNEFNIKREFETKSFRKKCLRTCGSIQT